LRSQRAQGYPRLYVFLSYQTAMLEMLAKCGGTLDECAEIVLEERHPEPAGHVKLPDAPGGILADGGGHRHRDAPGRAVAAARVAHVALAR